MLPPRKAGETKKGRGILCRGPGPQSILKEEVIFGLSGPRAPTKTASLQDTRYPILPLGEAGIPEETGLSPAGYMANRCGPKTGFGYAAGLRLYPATGLKAGADGPGRIAGCAGAAYGAVRLLPRTSALSCIIGDHDFFLLKAVPMYWDRQLAGGVNAKKLHCAMSLFNVLRKDIFRKNEHT